MTAAGETAATQPRCRVCGSTNTENLGRPAHHLPTKVAGVPINVTDLNMGFFRCRDCGYAFIDPPVPESRLLDCYAQSSGSHWPTDEAVAYQRFYSLKRDLLHRFAPGRRVLDFGCYDGGFLDYLGPEFDRNGIEPSTAAADRARQRGVNVLAPTIDALPFAGIEPFDAILIFDVMEHLIAPVETLNGLARLLKPGGIMLIETGNYDSPAFKKLGPRYVYAAIVEHVGFFNRSSIAKAAQLAGLSLTHFEESQHSMRPDANRAKFAAVNAAYSVLRAARALRIPLTTRLANIAAGPVPRSTCLRDHFLAVLQNPNPHGSTT
jgi:SAM-dependent methyltransferase